MLTNEIMQNYTTLVLEIKLLLQKRQKNKTYYDPNLYIVYSKKSKMIIARGDDHTITRNASFFKKASQYMLDDSYSDYKE